MNFIKYLLRYPINYLWTLGSLLFIGLFIYSAYQYKAPVFYVLALIPFIMLVYNFVSEFFAYKNWGKGKELAVIFYGACFIVLFVVITILIV